MKPLVTIGVVTNRPRCRDWLRWNLTRVRYTPIEIILVDASKPFDAELGLQRGAMRVGNNLFSDGPAEVAISKRELCPGDTLSCGELRNLVIAHANGTYLTWMDDDDWYHPHRIEWLLEAIQKSGSWGAGWWNGYLFELKDKVFQVLGTPQFKRLINGAAIYDLDMVKDVAYDNRPRASDGRWIVNLMKRHGDSGFLIDDDRPHALFTRHDRNTSPTRGYGGAKLRLSSFRDKVGAAAWGDTDAQLVALERALSV